MGGNPEFKNCCKPVFILFSLYWVGNVLDIGIGSCQSDLHFIYYSEGYKL